MQYAVQTNRANFTDHFYVRSIRIAQPKSLIDMKDLTNTLCHLCYYFPTP